MIKLCCVNRYLNESNKRTIGAVCEEYGYEVSFFDIPEGAEEKLSEAEVLYCSNPDPQKYMRKLRWCQSISAGVDRFIKSGCFDSGEAILTNSSGAYGRAISEHIIMVTLMLMHRMPDYQKIVAKRQWRMHLPIRSVAGSHIAIVGTGDIGSSAAERFRALGAERVTGFNRSGRRNDAFDDVFTMSEFTKQIRGADAVVICIPGTKESEGLISSDMIAALPEKAFLVNVGRGTLIDQDALIEALNNERIAGAALDVAVPEPLPADHPLWTAKNCIITPHCSGDYGLQFTVEKAVDIFCDNLKRYAKGEELINRVDPEKGY